MTPLATRILCLLCLLLVTAAASAQPRPAGRDVWIAVIDEDGGLEPVSALVGGRWWDFLEAVRGDAAEPDRARRRFIEGLPQRGKLTEESKWIPLGKPAPTSWQGHLLDGHQTLIRTPGRLQEDIEGRFVLKTNLTAPLTNIAPGSVRKGVAVAGSVDVSVFLEVAESRQAELLRAEHRDGSVVYFVTGHRTGFGSLQECGLETSLIAHEVDGGDLQIDHLYVESYCGGRSTLQPLAVLERDGVRCWFSEWDYEDGASYGLTAAERILGDGTTGSGYCALRE
jgi:hypothetical protein